MGIIKDDKVDYKSLYELACLRCKALENILVHDRVRVFDFTDANLGDMVCGGEEFLRFIHEFKIYGVVVGKGCTLLPKHDFIKVAYFYKGKMRIKKILF